MERYVVCRSGSRGVQGVWRWVKRCAGSVEVGKEVCVVCEGEWRGLWCVEVGEEVCRECGGG